MLLILILIFGFIFGQNYQGQVYVSQQAGDELFVDGGVIKFGPTSLVDEDILFADFEDPVWPRGWIASSDFPYPGPLTLEEANAAPAPSGYGGQRFVTTLKGDGATGTLTSPPFQIQRKYIHLKVGGGDHPDEAYVGLFINNQRVVSSTGDNSATFHSQIWDVTAYVGQTAEIRVVDSTQGGWGFIMCDDIVFSNFISPNYEYITINTAQKYQEIIGFGGAFTETSAFNWASLDAANRQQVLNLLFDPTTGLDMSVCRTAINSPDFALEEYTYVTDEDPELKTFELGQDRKYVLPFVKAAKAVQGDKLLLFASPWSPPAFMKSNGKMEDGGKLLPEFYSSWANYFVRYLQEYAKEGIDFWGVTVQNEPLATQTWESCIFSGAEEGDFATNYLRPAFDANGLEDIKIQIWDHNKDVAAARADSSYSIPGALKAVWGVGTHWYGGDHFEALDYIHRTYPDHHITTTEFCRGDGSGLGDTTGESASTWEDMAAYAHEIIGDLNNWVEAITDWNMIVDQDCGPYHNRVGGVRASIVVDRNTGEFSTGYIYHSIGHFSKFIKRGAVRVQTISPGKIEAVSAVNKDGSIAIVLLNRASEPWHVYLNVDDAWGEADLDAYSLTTVHLKPVQR